MASWLALVLSLPSENTAVRMRLWRALRAAGVAVLRDGVYLLPQRDSCTQLFDSCRKDVASHGGTAFVLDVADNENTAFVTLFKRSQEYAQLLDKLAQLQANVTLDSLPVRLKLLRKLRKTFAAIVSTDYFPDETQTQVHAALVLAEIQFNGLLSPTEPRATVGVIERLDRVHYCGRRWATRKRPWVDRLASAWLIRRFIDNQAVFLWLDTPADCPSDALGFDFDGAQFSHVDERVTFEVLLMSFGLEQPALHRLGTLIHFLDIGGTQPSEANGLEQILWGLRNTLIDDDQLLTAASSVFDALYTAFTEKS